MANKSLGTRQKLSFRIEPSQQTTKPRNPVAVAAQSRKGGPHQKSQSSLRQGQKRLLKKIVIDQGNKD
ncbi:MAG TPA: hypothetical protein VIF82_02870 [Burkholderiaceae bacterium]|jgi:hypothetical protein